MIFSAGNQANCVRFFDVRRLPAFRSATEQDHQSVSLLRLLHSVAGAEIDSQLPNPLLAELVITKVFISYPVNPPLNHNPAFYILETIKPVLIGILA